MSLSVSDLTRYLRQLLESDMLLQDVWVQGEISNLSMPSSGHVYFTLKDPTAALRCVIWRSQAQYLKRGLQNGAAIEAHGSIGVYERDGQYQLYIDSLRLGGAGWLYQEFLRLKARLEAEGLFDEERKRPLPARPRCIGIVTSPTGAALQDMLNTLRKRYPLAEVILAPAAVQGQEAPPEIVAALQNLNRLGKPEVILVCRGGGSLEDLWAFNDERVVRAIAASLIPVVTGVGHETDFTLADFAADLRAPTPTGAAVLCTPDILDLHAGLDELNGRLLGAFTDQVEDRRDQFTYAAERLLRASPVRRVHNDRQRLDQLTESMQRHMQHRLALQRAGWQGAAAHLESLNPLAILQRGFAVVRKPDGSLVRSAQQVQPGEQVQVDVSDGMFHARVE
ncbi:MAG: exodeoxyribonuclease VII large subunit [Chloroflexi bacterium]|nr:exodeoxyribonuclease VII large subunit [Chloroflexota bacterium]